MRDLGEQPLTLGGLPGAAQVSGVIVLNIGIVLAEAIAGGIGPLGLFRFIQFFVDQARRHLHVCVRRILRKRALDGIARVAILPSRMNSIASCMFPAAAISGECFLGPFVR